MNAVNDAVASRPLRQERKAGPNGKRIASQCKLGLALTRCSVQDAADRTTRCYNDTTRV